jgi:hypothetical protein
MGTTFSDDEMSEIVQETRIDLSVWLRYEFQNETMLIEKANLETAIG